MKINSIAAQLMRAGITIGKNVTSCTLPQSERIASFKGVAHNHRIEFSTSPKTQAHYKRLLAWNNLEPLIEKLDTGKKISTYQRVEALRLILMCSTDTTDTEVIDLSIHKWTDEKIAACEKLIKELAKQIKNEKENSERT